MLINHSKYLGIVTDIKDKIKAAQYNAILSANRELIMLYWSIGKVIIENSTWGNKFIDNLSSDIRLDFPNIKGFSVRNLKYMRKFAEEYPDFEFVQTLSAQITWSHNTAIMDKVKDRQERIWYVNKKTIENGWSLNVLLHQLEMLKKDSDNPSIGILLCKSKDKLIAEYALRDMSKPIGISEYRLSNHLPKEFEKTLPSVEDIEKRISAKYDTDGV